MKKVLIRTVDIDVVVISIGVFEQLDLLELCLDIGTGKHLIKMDIKSKKATNDSFMHLLDVTKFHFFRKLKKGCIEYMEAPW